MQTSKKINLAVVFGSRTCEHDVSVISALQFMDAADKDSYNIFPVYISREGEWFTGDRLREIAFYRAFDASEIEPCFILPVPLAPPSEAGAGHSRTQLCYWPKNRFFRSDTHKVITEIDVVIPIMHGVNGEDGTLQGLLELANVPYAQSGVAGCALGMDKIVMKNFFKGCGYNVVESVWFERGEFEQDQGMVVARAERVLSYPMIVKPANLGSSIGIRRATDKKSLIEAMQVALSYDRRILVERAIEQLEEVNCSVLGFGTRVEASVCEMPISADEILSFDDKYLRGGTSKTPQGMESLDRRIPAPISDELTRKIREISCEIFTRLDCRGVVRIDYMIDKADDTLYVNEINMIPGSMAFYLWEKTGLPYSELIDRLVEYAYLAHAEKNKGIFSFDSSILSKVNLGGKKGGE